MQRNPVETDFVIEVHPITIEILFVPTGTWFTFRRSFVAVMASRCDDALPFVAARGGLH